MVEESTLNRLRAEAEGARARAYAPYSGFRVGAVVETATGRVFAGCNVENAAYSVAMCAERVALGSAVAAGETEIRRVYVCSSSPAPVPPCGVCRQALSEFGEDIEVVSEGTDGSRRTWALEDLLPDRFRLEDHVTEAEGTS